MNVLSYGYKQPAAPDRGAVWFAALSYNIQRQNDHNHDGSNSAQLSVLSLSTTTSTLAAASWVLVAGGTYSQTVTVPAGINLNNCVVTFKHSNGSNLNLSFTQNSSTSFTAYINDNTVTVTAVYGL